MPLGHRKILSFLDSHTPRFRFRSIQSMRHQISMSGNMKVLAIFLVSTSILFILSLSSTYFVAAISTGTFVGSQPGKSAIVNDYVALHGGRNASIGYNSCSSFKVCGDCMRTYTCHWCERSGSCHARGSIYGCAWGDSCSEDVNPHNNSTCASQTTCFDCTQVSRFCHWCEHDNACHAVGSRFGCAIGVSCYSNDQCRRSKPEPLPSTSSPIQLAFATLDRIPVTVFVSTVFLGVFLFGGITCCYYLISPFKEARSVSVSGIDSTGFTGLEESTDEAVQLHEGNGPGGNWDTVNENQDNSRDDNADFSGNDAQHTQQCNNQLTVMSEVQNSNHVQYQQIVEESGNHNYPRNGTGHNCVNRYQLHIPENEMDLLHPSFNGTAEGVDEPRQLSVRHIINSTMYYFSVFTIALTVGASLFFYPQIPECNVCNDEVAWTKIMKNIVSFQFDVSFEILASLRNPNHISAILERGNGSFSFDGKQFGTFEIPPTTINSMAITDFMIVIHVSPADKIQALHLAKAYHLGKLAVNVNFDGQVNAPVLFGYTKGFNFKNIQLDVSAASNRSLCQCQEWEDGENDFKIGSFDSIESLSLFL